MKQQNAKSEETNKKLQAEIDQLKLDKENLINEIKEQKDIHLAEKDKNYGEWIAAKLAQETFQVLTF